MTNGFRQSVESFAEAKGIPIVRFERGVRKDSVAAKHRAQFGDREGVVFIGVAQERAQAFRAVKKPKSGFVSFEYSRQTVCVNHYYFYLQDADFGPAFIKIGTYAPFPIKVCINGHEWAKRQLQQRGIAFESLDNGFLSCEDPAALQAVCDELGAQQIEAFFRKWIERLPFPLTSEDRAAGYRHDLSIWQVETSLTHVFIRPIKGRELFEEVIRENVDLGRPDRMQLVFDRRLTKRTPGRFRTRVIQRGVQPSLHVEYKRSHIKQYFKQDRALRTETTINNPNDFGVRKSLRHLSHLQTISRNINRRLLEVQRVSQNCTLSQEGFERVMRPTVTDDGQRASGLPFGDRRVMGLLAALLLFAHVPEGFRNRDLRDNVTQLVGSVIGPYTSAKMTYDLRRLRLKGLIVRTEGTHRYFLTTHGARVALLFTRINARVLRPAWAALTHHDPIPRPLQDAFDAVNQQIDLILDHAKLTTPRKVA